MEIFMGLLMLLGGTGVFIAGMVQMSQSIESSTGSGFKRFLQKISGSPLAGYGVGIGVTAVVQSASATCIMTVGLAGANAINVKQGSAIILGSKVGTTVSAFVFALSGVSKGSFSVGLLFASTAFLGVIMSLVARNERVRSFASFLTGFGMLFFGLEAMGMAIGGAETTFGRFIGTLFRYELMQSPVPLFLLGILLTCVIQSSTAAAGIFITLLKVGIIGSVDQAIFLMLGANIGTCMDSVLVSLGTNTNGKRLALFNVLTSAVGAFSFLVITVLFRKPLTAFLNRTIIKPEWSLAVFNLFYNGIYTVILLPFLNFFARLTDVAFTEKGKPLRRAASKAIGRSGRTA